ncbi:hypothetical protein EMIT093MI4_60208 [Pseudomonas sp. IT-93MI4]
MKIVMPTFGSLLVIIEGFPALHPALTAARESPRIAHPAPIKKGRPTEHPSFIYTAATLWRGDLSPIGCEAVANPMTGIWGRFATRRG